MRKLLSIIVLGLLLSGNAYGDVIATAKHKNGSETFKSMPYSDKSYAESIALAKCRTSALGKKDPAGCYVINSKSKSSSSSKSTATEKTSSSSKSTATEDCHNFLEHSANYKENNKYLEFKFKSTSSKTIKIYDWGLLSKSGDYMKKSVYPFYIKPYGVIYKDLNVSDLNLDVSANYQYYCSFESKPKAQKQTYNFKKGNWFTNLDWWEYILITLVALGIIGKIIEANEGNSSKNKKKPVSKSETSSKSSSNNDNLIEDVWKGRKPLGESFWLYYFVINGIISVGAGYLADANDNNIFLIAALISNIWAGVGTWNSSTNYQLQKIKAKQPYGWAYGAKILIVLNFLTIGGQAILLFNL